MESKFTIQKFSKEESAKISEFQYLMAKETEGKELDEANMTKSIEFFYDQKQYGFFLTTRDQDKPIGCLLITFAHNMYLNQNQWWYQSVFVEKDYRGQGIFKNMFKHIEDSAKVTNIPMYLYVELENERAQNVYKRLGMRDSNMVFIENDFFFNKEQSIQFSDKSYERLQCFQNSEIKDDLLEFLEQSESLFQFGKIDQSNLKKELVICIRDNDKIVGTAFTFLEYSDWRQGFIIYIYDMRIKNEVSIEQLGSRLANFVKNEYKADLPIVCTRFLINENIKDTIDKLVSIGYEQAHYRVYVKDKY